MKGASCAGYGMATNFNLYASEHNATLDFSFNPSLGSPDATEFLADNSKIKYIPDGYGAWVWNIAYSEAKNISCIYIGNINIDKEPIGINLRIRSPATDSDPLLFQSIHPPVFQGDDYIFVDMRSVRQAHEFEIIVSYGSVDYKGSMSAPFFGGEDLGLICGQGYLNGAVTNAGQAPVFQQTQSAQYAQSSSSFESRNLDINLVKKGNLKQTINFINSNKNKNVLFIENLGSNIQPEPHEIMFGTLIPKQRTQTASGDTNFSLEIKNKFPT